MVNIFATTLYTYHPIMCSIVSLFQFKPEVHNMTKSVTSKTH